MTIFSFSLIEISCGGEDVRREKSESEGWTVAIHFGFDTCGLSLLNDASTLCCTGNLWKNYARTLKNE